MKPQRRTSASYSSTSLAIIGIVYFLSQGHGFYTLHLVEKHESKNRDVGGEKLGTTTTGLADCTCSDFIDEYGFGKCGKSDEACGHSTGCGNEWKRKDNERCKLSCPNSMAQCFTPKYGATVTTFCRCKHTVKEG